MRDSLTIWKGTSHLDGEIIAVIARKGGNKKVSGGDRQVLALSVVPMVTVTKVRAADHGQPAIKLGTTYIKSLRVGAINSVCHNACEHKGNGKCYAQFNAQSVSEPVTTIRKGYGPVGNLAAFLKSHRFMAGDRYRTMVVGSSGAVPPDAMAVIIGTFNAFGMLPLAYVENWRQRPDLRDSHMASCYSIADVADAKTAGWRPFYSPAAESLGNTLPDGMVLCPGSAYRERAGFKRISCATCGFCDGSGRGASRPGVVSPRHGNGDSSRVASLVRKGILDTMIVNAKRKMVGAYA